MSSRMCRPWRRGCWTSKRTTKRLPGRLSGSSLGRTWTNSLSSSPGTSSTRIRPLPEGQHEYVTELTSQSTKSTDVFAEVDLNATPQASLDDGGHFVLALTFRTSLASAELPVIAGWVVDAEGKKAEDSCYRTDNYIQLKDKLPHIEDFYLGDLPPIVPKSKDQSD